jgi:hypothetical protein
MYGLSALHLILGVTTIENDCGPRGEEKPLREL